MLHFLCYFLYTSSIQKASKDSFESDLNNLVLNCGAKVVLFKIAVKRAGEKKCFFFVFNSLVTDFILKKTHNQELRKKSMPSPEEFFTGQCLDVVLHLHFYQNRSQTVEW